MRRFTILSGLLFFSILAFGQDTLPKFNVSNLGNGASGNTRIIVSWSNNYDSLKQLNIQTSHDSLKNYRTLVSIADPNAKLNGFADNKAVNDHMFYRLFIVKKDGSYFFTVPRKPAVDTIKTVVSIPINRQTPDIKKPEVVIKKPD